MIFYPPIVGTSKPAFPADQDLKIYFQFPFGITNLSNYTIDYTVVSQIDNESIIDKNKTNGSDIVKRQTPLNIDTNPYIIIDTDKFKNPWQEGAIYKIQLRLSKYSTYNPTEYSEWSSVCYVKALSPSNSIKLSILNELEDGGICYNESPLWMGQLTIPDKNQESQLRFKFDLFDANNNFIETSGWQLHTNPAYDSFVFPNLLENYNNYTVTYSIETKNGYIASTDYRFFCSFGMLESSPMLIECETNYEEGAVKVHITNDELMVGNIVLRRTDSRSNFTIWEDYKIFNILDSKIDIIFNDYLIENGIEYRYGAQLVSEKRDSRSRGPLFQSKNILAEYEHMFLVGNEKQLKIKYNPKVSSWKRQLQESKTETIGSKYPFILRSGAVNYFTFPISGLVSYHSDEAEAFCSKNSLCVSGPITTENDYNVNLDLNNIVLEREFRNKVEEFLTNGDYKYFKSPTEGIKLVAVTGVSLTPNDTTGRMIYTFSSTAYEVGEATLTKSLDIGIINKGEVIAPAEMGTKEMSGFFTYMPTEANASLWKEIAKIVRYPQDEEEFKTAPYTRQLKYLKSIKIELLSRIPSSGYPIYLNFGEPDDVQIIISSQIGSYEIKDVAPIYDVALSAAQMRMNVTYTAICDYSINEEGEDNRYSSTESSFYQLAGTFDDIEYPFDIFEAIKQNYVAADLSKVANLMYLRIDCANDQALVEINGYEYVIGPHMTLEAQQLPVLSASFKQPTYAQVSVVFNGLVK